MLPHGRRIFLGQVVLDHPFQTGSHTSNRIDVDDPDLIVEDVSSGYSKGIS